MKSALSPRRAGGRPRCRQAPALQALEGRLLLATDLTAPTTTAAVIGPLGDNGFYTGPAAVRLSATDPDDAPDTLRTEFSLNGAPFVTGNSLRLTADGIDTILYRSVDPAGNLEATRSLVVKVDQTAPVLVVAASPTSLWPPNHKLVPVVVTGRVADNLSGVDSTLSFRTRDEYGRVQPAGTVLASADGSFTFTVSLQSSRLGQDKNGRQYVVFVTASDQAGNTTTQRVVVTVPHDQGRHNGNAGQVGTGGQVGPGGSTGQPHGQAKQHAAKHSSGHGRNGGSAPVGAPSTGPSHNGDASGRAGQGEGHSRGHGHGHDD